MKMFIKPSNLIFSNIKAMFTTKGLKSSHINDVIARELNISRDNIYLPIQKHTNKIHVLEYDMMPVVADAVLTKKKGILIGVQVADCIPILLYDNHKKVIGAVHAGWRGTAKQILKNTIKMMHERFHTSTKDVLIAFGPGIRQCCYVVDEDVKTAVHEATGDRNFFYKQDKKFFIDLLSANKTQALSMGIIGQNIWQSDDCTFCNPDKYYSYRYTGGNTGKQGGLIGIF